MTGTFKPGGFRQGGKAAIESFSLNAGLKEHPGGGLTERIK